MAKKTKSKKLGFFQKVKKDQIVGAEKSLIEKKLFSKSQSAFASI